MIERELIQTLAACQTDKHSTAPAIYLPELSIHELTTIKQIKQNI